MLMAGREINAQSSSSSMNICMYKRDFRVRERENECSPEIITRLRGDRKEKKLGRHRKLT